MLLADRYWSVVSRNVIIPIFQKPCGRVLRVEGWMQKGFKIGHLKNLLVLVESDRKKVIERFDGIPAGHVHAFLEYYFNFLKYFLLVNNLFFIFIFNSNVLK